MFGLREIEPTGPPVLFEQSADGETHIHGGLWLVDKTIHVGPNSQIIGTKLYWDVATFDGVAVLDGAPQPSYGGFYLTPARYTRWGRFLRLRPIRWLRWHSRFIHKAG